VEEDLLSNYRRRRYAFALVAPGREGQLPNGAAVHSLAEGPLAHSRDLLPSLLELASLSTRQLDELYVQVDLLQRDGDLPLLCALFEVEPECNADRLQRHLAAVQVWRGPGGSKGWLRAHDPRVWIQLQRVLRADSLQKVFGPVTSWSVPFGERWWRVDRNEALRDVSGKTEEAEWAALKRVGAVNRALARLGLWSDCAAVNRDSPALDELIQEAQRRHGVHRVDDLAAYAWFASVVHRDFDRHPIGMEILARADGDAHLADLLEAVSKEQREAMCRDLTIEGTRT